MLPKHLDNTLLNQNTVVFDPTESTLNKNYLFFLLQTVGYRDHLDLHAHGTANQSSLSISDMLDFDAPLPPIEEQIEIANIISQNMSRFDSLEARAIESQSLLQERRTALISAAVTGKIDVRDWEPPQH